MYPNRTLEIIFDLVNCSRVGDSGRQWKGHCPAHEDAHSSLTIGLGDDDKILLHCKAGCSTDSIRRALGLTWADLASPHTSSRRNGSDYPRLHKPQPIRRVPREDSKTPAELQAMLKKLEADPDCVRGVARYAAHLGLSAQVLWDLGARWNRLQVWPKSDNDPGELWYPERDGDGEIIGIGIRCWDGSKRFVTGSHRGVHFQSDVLERTGPVYLVEGLTDTAVLLALGLCAIGRPSNKGGWVQIGKLLAAIDADREIIVVGENDRKPSGFWPGREGAEETARELAALLNRPVKAALVAEPFKDTREWFQAPHAANVNLGAAYRASLTVFAEFPVAVQEVTDEEIEANIVSFRGKGAYTYPEELCPNPRHQLHKHKETHLLREMLVRCGCNTCPQCLLRKKRLRHEALCRHMTAEEKKGGQLHCAVACYSKREWEATRRAILRQRGQFIRYRHEGNRFYVISTLAFAGSRPLPFDEAEKWAKHAVDNSVCGTKKSSFFSSSKGWAMVRELPTKQYERLGNIHMPPQAVKQLCEQKLGVNGIDQVRPPDSALLIKGYINYAARDGVSDPFVQLLLDRTGSLSSGCNTNDSDRTSYTNYFFRRLPPKLDEWWGGLMDPTG